MVELKKIDANLADRKVFHQNLTAWIQRKGFVWGPSPELYGGLAGFYDYAPMGKLLKNRVESVIRDTFSKNAFWEMECPIVVPKAVWEASGHLGGFTDPIISCARCGAVFRADNLLNELFGVDADNFSDDELLSEFSRRDVFCPSCKKGKFKPEIKRHNLMMKTTVGLDSECYNRPETATTTYLPFTRYLSFFRDKLPFGVFQIGKAFRNEISPRQHIVRQREFTQAEGQLFLFKSQKDNFEKFDLIKNDKANFLSAKTGALESASFVDAISKGFLKNQAYAWTVHLAHSLFLNMGIPESRIRLRQHGDDEKAFYADDAWDVEINLNSFGWTEVCGIHDRTDYDLSQHALASKQVLQARNEDTGQKETPHVLEIAFGTDRPVFALMDLFYSYDEEKKQDVFKVPFHVSPVNCAVFSLVKKGGLPLIAEDLHKTLVASGLTSVVDHAGSVGRRYARADEVGTPCCITVDFQTKEDDTVTIRDRDSTEQKRIKLSDVVSVAKELLVKSV